MRYLSLVSVFALMTAGNLFAVERCGQQSFKGTYAVLATGEVTVPGFPITGPFARAGLAVSDGRGNVEFLTTSSYNGFIFHPSNFVGTYEVTPDCRILFDAVVPFPIAEQAVIPGFIADNKREVRFVITAPPFQTVRGTLLKQSSSSCTEADLSGDYALELSGRFQQPLFSDPPIAPEGFTRLGKLVFDEWGNFTASTHANYNGIVIQDEDFSGTYTVSDNCRVTLEYFDGVQTVRWRGALASNGRIVTLIDAEQCDIEENPLPDGSNWCSAGRIVFGTLIKQ